MRIINIIFFLVMLAFAVLHYTTTGHDMWVYIYGVAALFCAIAAFHVDTYRHGEMFFLLMIGLAGAVFWGWYIFPLQEGLEVTAEWWQGGIARDSIGIGATIVALFCAMISAWSMQED